MHSRPAVREFLSGVLLLNKPVGLTSNTALQKAKRLLNARKAGHTGTLDPFADGLLPLCYGEATKFSHYLLGADKTYRAVMQLGVTTSTGDPEGEILQTRAVTVDAQDVRDMIQRFIGEIEQIPPMHSALKHQGRPLYEYARAGIEIDRPPRRVTIHSLNMVDCALPLVIFDVRCSSGTYIRTLAQDIGAALGCGAHLTALTRTASGIFDLADATTLENLEGMDAAQRTALLLPSDCLVQHLPEIELNVADRLALCQGRQVPSTHPAAELARIYDSARLFLGLAHVDSQGVIVPHRLINTSNET
ncbi:MAG: tRNA pseudouridine(55) synthase TruB [Thiobacillus sp.]